jgi:hypothetical protein
MMDGNYLANHYAKNCDPNDISLFSGRSYIPVTKEYEANIALARGEHLSVGLLLLRMGEMLIIVQDGKACESLKVAQNVEKKKVAAMDINGVISVQCNHIFNHATVDLSHGEQ